MASQSATPAMIAFQSACRTLANDLKNAPRALWIHQNKHSGHPKLQEAQAKVEELEAINGKIVNEAFVIEYTIHHSPSTPLRTQICYQILLGEPRYVALIGSKAFKRAVREHAAPEASAYEVVYNPRQVRSAPAAHNRGSSVPPAFGGSDPTVPSSSRHRTT